MPLKATERDIYEFFSQVGKVSESALLFLVVKEKLQVDDCSAIC